MTAAPLAVLWIAKAVASLGRAMTVVALPWLVLQLTGSGTQTGMAVASSGLDIAVVSFLAGTAIDRSGARRTTVAGLTGAGVAIGLVPLLDQWDMLSLGPLLVLVFAASALDSVAGAAVETLVPAAAKAARVTLESANAVLTGIDRFALLVMPAISAVVIALFGARTALWIDAVACLAAAALLAVTVPATARPATAGPSQRRYLMSLADGVRVLRRDRTLATLALLAAALNTLLSSVYSVLLLVYAAEVFGGAAHFAGMVAAVGGGAVVGALFFGVLGRRLPRRAWLLVSCFGAAATVLALSALPGHVPTLALLAASGLTTAPLGPLVSLVFQERSPSESLGRVLSARNALVLAGLPLGVLLTGIALDGLGLSSTLVLIGGLCLAVAGSAASLPALHRLETPATRPLQEAQP